jgi:glycosyltransferase involved in cell wall biosynthesis
MSISTESQCVEEERVPSGTLALCDEVLTMTEAAQSGIRNQELGISKVLVLTPSLARAGGIQRYTATLVRALKEEVGAQGVRCIALAEPSSHSGRGTQRVSAGAKLRFGWQALREAVRSRPDLIICTHLALGPIAWVLAKARRRPYWIVVHGIEAWGLLPCWKRGALRHADQVIVTSAFSKEQVVTRHHIDSWRISHLPCALDERLCEGSPQPSVRTNSGEGLPSGEGCKGHMFEGRRVVLTVARMAASENYKGHEVVLRALPSVIAKIPNLTCAVVGDGDDRIRLERLAEELGIADHVAFTGEVSDAELAALYRRSEVFALPARTVIDDHNPKGEGFGIVFLEAMAFGKPVIGPNYGAPSELIRHGENGLAVKPEDPAAVAEALMTLFTHPERTREMGQAGRVWVKTHYGYARFRERLRRNLISTEGSRLPKLQSEEIN